MTLTLERRAQADETGIFENAEGTAQVAITPPIDEDYWEYRVRLTESQSVVGFPKFFTIGIGFAVEDYDWNVNLPYTVETEKIVSHIWENAGDPAITREQVTEAVKLIQAAATEDRAK